MADRSRIRPTVGRLAGLALAVFASATDAASHAQDLRVRVSGDPAVLAPGLVASVDEAGDLTLDDGRVVRIAGLDILLEPDERVTLLSDLLRGRGIDIASVGRDRDRHGRVLATVVRDDGVDVGSMLLEQGVARLHPRPDLTLPPAHFEAEARARVAGRGLWSRPATRVRGADDATDLIGRYGVVEGRVLDAASVRGRIFLNFGRDRATDFTVTVAPEDAELFEAARLTPSTLVGRRILVRGYVEAVRGPSVALDDPRQIEVLGP